ncbi:DUF2460 domain-containing protein [Henriciella sp.]|uniref:DUF2460 domain-containing protein n=1 Tax=Henriciella sp. TaxID=1968823 RepID=UPI002611446B|nr:DUF2460 domain-containing protein [Henriciella sp.]
MSVEGFDDVRFPLAIGPGASGGPEWRTDIIALASGAEVRNARWAVSRRRWDVSTSVSSLADLAVLSAFFEARQGRLRGFRFRDPANHSSALPGGDVTATDQPVGTGDGATREFQLSRACGPLVKPVSKPVSGSVRIAINGAEKADGWSVDAASGQVTFDMAPENGADVTAGFEFDWPVRFDTDRLDITHEFIAAGRAVSVPLVELV